MRRKSKQDQQKERIIAKLLRTGIITRNECLDNSFDGKGRITRLSHYADKLENEGWVFEARYSKDGKDYGYILKSCPLRKEQYTLPNGEVIIKYAKNTP